MSYRLFPVPQKDWLSWARSLVQVLGQVDFDVPAGTIAMCRSTVPAGWEKLTSVADLPTIPGGSSAFWIIKV